MFSLFLVLLFNSHIYVHCMCMQVAIVATSMVGLISNLIVMGIDLDLEIAPCSLCQGVTHPSARKVLRRLTYVIKAVQAAWLICTEDLFDQDM